MGIGPLIPSAFFDEKDASDKSFGGELFQGLEDKYIEWLNSKPKTTAVYVWFGSKSVLQSHGWRKSLKDCWTLFGRPFLWVIRKKAQNDKKDDYNDDLSCRGELEKLGMIVPWCSKVLEMWIDIWLWATTSVLPLLKKTRPQVAQGMTSGPWYSYRS
ncbi:UDP-glucuronosyl/UDP-glucosyltransferase [Parasponia andersonii]|uniref:UDP-glucuronosyl/UDP-glucosyltransferase n=1 Tax=Parasponia andersonii TaxID=3476 RepID=A0A2P5C3M6_PARAD|nr:UDP-glucuronosyl/UDP-glucosyltransferase [Parasponia andersonii]